MLVQHPRFNLVKQALIKYFCLILLLEDNPWICDIDKLKFPPHYHLDKECS